MQHASELFLQEFILMFYDKNVTLFYLLINIKKLIAYNYLFYTNHLKLFTLSALSVVTTTAQWYGSQGNLPHFKASVKYSRRLSPPWTIVKNPPPYHQHQWTRTKVSSSPQLLFRKNLPNLRNPIWRALASKPLNPLMGSHVLSPHTFGSGFRFWKGSQKGVLKKLFFIYFLNLPNLRSPLWRALASKPLNRL